MILLSKYRKFKASPAKNKKQKPKIKKILKIDSNRKYYDFFYFLLFSQFFLLLYMYNFVFKN